MDTHPNDELLTGGRAAIRRTQAGVERPAGPWTPTVHALLAHLHATGFSAVPKPLFANDQIERVSYLAGEVNNRPSTDDHTLISAARLLRRYHDATVSFLAQPSAEWQWMLPPRTPAEVVCHGDFAPYNVVVADGDLGREAIGIIDFDTAHPAPRRWDIAYALYRWVPLTDPTNPDHLGGLNDQIRRARLFCGSYGLADRSGLVDVVAERLRAMLAFMQKQADAGDATFQSHIAAGHDRIYRTDLAFLQRHRDAFEKGTTAR